MEVLSGTCVDAFAIAIFFDSIRMLSTIRSLEFLFPAGNFYQKRSLWAIDIQHGHYAVLIWEVLCCFSTLFDQCLGGPLLSNIKTVTKVPSLHLGHLRFKIGGDACVGGGCPISAMSSGSTIFFLLLLNADFGV